MNYMKVLIVCSGNGKYISPFINDQIEDLEKLGIDCEVFTIKGKGIIGYLKNLPRYYKVIKKFNPDIIHAHYGLIGLLAVLQKKVPVIVTFHGGDIYKEQSNHFLLSLSLMASLLSSVNIFVNAKIPYFFRLKKHFVIPCGVNMEVFKPMDSRRMRLKYKLTKKNKYILFASNFNNNVKNYILAEKAIRLLTDQKIKIIELKGYTRLEVSELMNAVDLCLLTSFSEGSPQFVKEAMACNIPIVSTDVGDVKEVIGNTEGCYITSLEAEDVADKINNSLKFYENNGRTNGRERLIKLGLDSKTIAQKIIEVYKKVLKK